MSEKNLSKQFAQPVTGMFGGPRGRIRPRGAYAVAGVGDPRYGYAGTPGYAWNVMPGLLGGISGYAALSTITGVPVGTPEVESESKVGGGVTDAQVPDLGGTAAY